jgi:hypothetical protein
MVSIRCTKGNQKMGLSKHVWACACTETIWKDLENQLWHAADPISVITCIWVKIPITGGDAAAGRQAITPNFDP